jgi:hypothetical protein
MLKPFREETISYMLIAILAIVGMVLYSENQKLKKAKLHEESTCIQSDSVCLIRTTYYNAVVSQCNSDPLTTADGSKINLKKLNKGEIRWVALSQDLVKDEYKAKLHPGLFNGTFRFGDTICVYSEKDTIMNGCYVVRDVMNRRYRNSMDFLLPIGHPKVFGLGKDFKIIKK